MNFNMRTKRWVAALVTVLAITAFGLSGCATSGGTSSLDWPHPSEAEPGPNEF